MALRSGSCLCGAVSFKADVSQKIQACHCIQCQRWTGGGPLYSTKATDIEISGGETVSNYHASKWGERVFCKTCGSTLWWKMQGEAVGYVSTGLLDDQSDLRVTEEIFVDYRPAWLPPFEGASQSTEAEELAKLDDYLAGDAS